MTVVMWQEFRVRVRVMASTLDEVEGCLEEIRTDIHKAVNKKILSKRYHAEILTGPVREEPVNP